MSLLSIFRGRRGSEAAQPASNDAGPRAAVEQLENRRLLYAFGVFDDGGYGTNFSPPASYDTGFYHGGPVASPRGIGDGGGGGGGFGGGPFQPPPTPPIPPDFEPTYPEEILGPMLSQLANPPDSRIVTYDDWIQYTADSFFFGASALINAFPDIADFIDPAEFAAFVIEEGHAQRHELEPLVQPWLPLPFWNYREIQWGLDIWWRGMQDASDPDLNFGDFSGFGGFGGGGFGGGGFGGGGPGDGGGGLPRGNPVTVFRGAFGGRYG